MEEYNKAYSRAHHLYSILIIATVINEISLWIIQQLLHSGTLTTPLPPNLSTIVQNSIFGGVLMLETHPEEDPQLAFLDENQEAWIISSGWLMFKLSEGPSGMPFIAERRFQKRRAGHVRKIGGVGGSLETVLWD